MEKNKRRNSKKPRSKHRVNNKRKHTRRIKRNFPKNDKIKLFGRVFSQGCVHCVAMGAEWKKIIEFERKKQTPPMKDIGDNYDDEIKSINDQYDTKLEAIGLPTIFRIKELSPNNFDVEYYNSERTAISIMKWVWSL